MKRFLIICPFFFWISSAQGEIYSWTDPKGTGHYTNSLDDVPLRYRAGMKVLTYDAGQKSEAAQAVGQMKVMPAMPQADRKSNAGGIQAQPVQLPPPVDQEHPRKKRHDRKRDRGNAPAQ